jgi:hypothetical protein
VEFGGIASHKSFIGRGGSGQDRLGQRLSITVVAFRNCNALRSWFYWFIDSPDQQLDCTALPEVDERVIFVTQTLIRFLQILV